MQEVFVSYSSRDRPRVKQLVAALEAGGRSVWWDRDIAPGKTFDDTIETALNAARCVLVVWSEDSVSSDWVKTEAAAAARRGVLLPVLIDDVEPPLEFRRTQAADLIDWTGESTHPGLQQLLKAIEGMAEQFGRKLPQDELEPTQSERRLVTVLSIHFSGLGELVEAIDPEDLDEIVREARRRVERTVAELDGQVGSFQGDRMLAFFGYPVASESDPRRAVLAGLRLVREGLRVGHDAARDLLIRCGIHSGPVVVGERGPDGHRDQLALGPTPNRATRIQEAAESGTLLISAETHKLVEAFFECREARAEGSPDRETESRFVVVRELDAAGRGEASPRLKQTPFVARAAELAVLERSWEKARDGAGQLVLVNGAPGIGKSRLTNEFLGKIRAECSLLQIDCWEHTRDSALYPVKAYLHRRLNVSSVDGPEDKLAKLELAFSGSSISPELAVPLLASLLSLPPSENYPVPVLDPFLQKRMTLELLLDWLVFEARDSPIVVLCEDLQWADPSTLELLTLLIDQISTSPTLVIGTFRSEFEPPWGLRSFVTYLALSPLTSEEALKLAGLVSGEAQLAGPLLEALVGKTGGVPLFVEELTKAVLESEIMQPGIEVDSTGPLPKLEIPSTLEGSLLARLDRLGPAKETAQLAATLGREFPFELIHSVSRQPEERLKAHLVHMVRREFLIQRGHPPNSRYLFKNSLTQHAAYESLLKKTRRELHRRTAQALEEGFPELIATTPELLAQQLAAGGLPERAIPVWHMAAVRATQRAENVEALRYLERSLRLLLQIAEGPARDRLEIEIQTSLGYSLMNQRGYGDVEVERAYQRAYELAQTIQDSPELGPILYGLFSFHSSRAQYAAAESIGTRLQALGRDHRDERILLVGHNSVGLIEILRGNLRGGSELTRQSIEIADRLESAAVLHSYGGDFRAYPRVWQAIAESLLGHPDRAGQRFEEALELTADHIYTRAFVRCFCPIAVFFRDFGGSRANSQELLEVSERHGFVLLGAIAKIYLGWVAAVDGASADAEETILEGLEVVRGVKLDSFLPHYLSLLGEARAALQKVPAASSAIDEALALVREAGGSFYAAELERLKGGLLRTAGAPDELVSGHLRRAIAIAREQEATWWELRATVDLCRHLKGAEGSQEGLTGLLQSLPRDIASPDVVAARDLLESRPVA